MRAATWVAVSFALGVSLAFVGITVTWAKSNFEALSHGVEDSVQILVTGESASSISSNQRKVRLAELENYLNEHGSALVSTSSGDGLPVLTIGGKINQVPWASNQKCLLELTAQTVCAVRGSYLDNQVRAGQPAGYLGDRSVIGRVSSPFAIEYTQFIQPLSAGILEPGTNTFLNLTKEQITHVARLLERAGLEIHSSFRPTIESSLLTEKPLIIGLASWLLSLLLWLLHGAVFQPVSVTEIQLQYLVGKQVPLIVLTGTTKAILESMPGILVGFSFAIGLYHERDSLSAIGTLLSVLAVGLTLQNLGLVTLTRHTTSVAIRGLT